MIQALVPSFTKEELRDLAYAKALLEKPGLTIRLANLIGSPIEQGFALLPKNWSQLVNKATKSALLKALEIAVATMGKQGSKKSSERFHKFLVGASGGIGGVFGLAALPLELPISTGIMLRSIAEIARSEGHDPAQVSTKLACLEVFALGGPSKSDNAAESAYWVTRLALSQTISEATSYLAQKGIVERGAPVIMRLISAIASRFGIIISEEVAAKAIPVVGAASGSIINVLFIDHFQQMARGHFIVQRLEAKYGLDPVKASYQEIAIQMR
jgi:hypothetical protein